MYPLFSTLGVGGKLTLRLKINLWETIDLGRNHNGGKIFKFVKYVGIFRKERDSKLLRAKCRRRE